MEKDTAVEREELACPGTELISTAVVSSPGLPGGLLVRCVADKLGVVVTPRVDDMRPGVGTRVVKDVYWEVDGEGRVGVGRDLDVVGIVDRCPTVLEVGTWAG